jgi:hypothetical protein
MAQLEPGRKRGLDRSFLRAVLLQKNVRRAAPPRDQMQRGFFISPRREPMEADKYQSE